MSDSGNGRVTVPANAGLSFTGDVYAGGSLLGVETRYSIPEPIELNSTGTFDSVVNPAAGVRLVILGVTFDWPDKLTGQIDVTFKATLAGSAILGTTDATLGTHAQALSALHLELDEPPGNFDLAPSSLRLVTSEGDGVTSLYQFAVTNPGNDTLTATVFYAPLYSSAPC